MNFFKKMPNIHAVSLYLDGHYPPWYRACFDKLQLIEIVRRIAPDSFTNDFFKIINSNDFYYYVLNRVIRTRPNKLNDIYAELDIPSELYN